jgi:ubiquinone/menaquinone biosynthesis C-methylase UbiE
MADYWNLTDQQWSDVLLNGFSPVAVARGLESDHLLPWTETLLERTSEADRVLDLGSGRGENAAVLAKNRRQVTLLDWSQNNLDFSSRLFASMGLTGKFCRGDMTKVLPFEDGAFDVVYSCGVFEYFTSKEKAAILREAFRIARKRVIIMVPNAYSVAYRVGMWYMKQKGQWHWGGEVPSYTLKPLYRQVGCSRITEFSLATRHSFDFLKIPQGDRIKNLLLRILGQKDSSRPAFLRQGYLLVTIGDK